MKNFYCMNCSEYVDLVDGKCPKCHTDWKKILEENNPNKQYEDNNIPTVTVKEITEEDLDYNIYNLLSFARIGKIFLIIVALIIAAGAFIAIDATNGYSALLLIPSFITIFLATVFENNVKWKAYMLYTNIHKQKTKK